MKRDEVREREIIRRRAGGETLASIGLAYGVSESRIHRIIRAARTRGECDGPAYISDADIHATWKLLGYSPVEIWIVPQGRGIALRLVTSEAWVQGAVLMGTYTSLVTLAYLADDVRAAEAEYWRIRRAS